jgi:phosphatidylserine/phosphatidylglycerophosphate/cardiolipin synthase-like enzyme
MEYLLIGTGVTGTLTVLYLARLLYNGFRVPPSIAVHFSPKGGCTDAIVRELGQARHAIQVLAYSFSSKPIAQALIDAKLRGIHVEIVLDHSNEKEAYSDLHFFIEQGLVPVVDPHHPIAHNKVILIDDRTLITGSFNFTHQAEADNAENMLIIKGHPDIVHAYRANFALHKDHSRAAETKAGVTVSHSHRAA